MARGTFYLMVSAVVFVLANYVVQIWLGRYLGPEEYGILGIILALMNMVNLFMTSGVPQSASKYIAEDNSRVGSIIWHADRVQLALACIVFAIYFSLSGVIADLLNDHSLTPYIMFSALSIPAYGAYHIYVSGYLNGLRHFNKQAVVSMLTSLTKLVLVFSLVALGLKINGAVAGYIIAALFGFLLAWIYLRPVRTTRAGFEWKMLVKFSIPTALFSVLFILLISIDLYTVKALGIGGVEVGYYTSSSTISKISYFLFSGLAMTLLPSISRSTSDGDVQKTRSYILQSFRYMLMLIGPIIVLTSATSPDLLTLLYSSMYLGAADSLSILVFGLGFFSVFFVLANIIIGSGKPKVTVWMVLPLVVMDILLNIYLIPRYGLTGAAWATTATGFVGMCAAAVYVYWKFKALINALSALKIVLASVVIYLIALNASVPPAWLVPLYIGLAVLYLGLLWLGREIRREDIELVKKIVSMRKVSSK